MAFSAHVLRLQFSVGLASMWSASIFTHWLLFEASIQQNQAKPVCVYMRDIYHIQFLTKLESAQLLQQHDLCCSRRD